LFLDAYVQSDAIMGSDFIINIEAGVQKGTITIITIQEQYSGLSQVNRIDVVEETSVIDTEYITGRDYSVTIANSPVCHGSEKAN